jgi:subtilisin family serine protease
MRRFLVIGVVLAACLSGPPATAAPSAPAQPGDVITLITGDRVLLGGAGGASIRPADGREQVRFLTQRDVQGDVHVTPLDALPMLRSGQLDPRLFNVSKLIEFGYGDATRPDIPLIVEGAPGIQSLPSLNASAFTVGKDSRFWNARSGSKIWLDGPVKALLDKSVPQIGAPAAWQAGLTGKDTKVVILDTGVDRTHPDLADAVIEERDFTNSPNGPKDENGHGTHVASIVTGNNPTYMGVAPDTKVISGRVLSRTGNGSESGVLAGMQWAATTGAPVINMSLGSDMPSDGTDIVSQAVNTLTAQSGALFVIASGNSGGLVGSPAAADAALTVGAVDSTDALADFSSRGPRLLDNAIKPDITAPGVDIVAAKSKGSFLDGKLPDVGENHFMMSGTSMATPHVTGAAAILSGQHPEWKAADLKAALMNSAKPTAGRTVFEQGAGRVDVAKAVARNVYATPGIINNGIVQWPHSDDKPIDHVLTYHNSGTTPVSVTPAVDVKNPSGKAAPAGMFKVTPTTVTVPPGGQAQATVTIDATVNAPDGIYGGIVDANGIRTPISLTREAESYNATFKFVGLDGKPTADYAMRLLDSVQPFEYRRYDTSGNLTVRLPKGHYFLDTVMYNGGEQVLAGEPDLNVTTGDVTLTVDQRDAKPVGLVLDRTGQDSFDTFSETSRTTPYGVFGSSLGGSYDTMKVRPSKTSLPGRFRFSVGGRFYGGAQSTYLYNVRADSDGRIPANPVMQVRDRDLVKVKSTHAATHPGSIGSRENVIQRPLPYTLDELYSPGVGFHSSFSETKDGQIVANEFTGAPRSHTREGTERFNYAVFGPDLPDNPERPYRYASRSGDTLIFQIPLFSDSGTNREGFSAHTGSTKLYRGDELLGSASSAGSGIYTVPVDAGTYRLHVEATRDRALTSKIVSDWTFKSATVAPEERQPLPMLAVRYDPNLDTSSRALRILPTIVPINISTNGRDIAAWPTKLKVSHDKGTTWSTAPLLSLGGKWFTALTHPRGAQSVSLQTDARDAAGNTVSQTIIDAFLLK